MKIHLTKEIQSLCTLDLPWLIRHHHCREVGSESSFQVIWQSARKLTLEGDSRHSQAVLPKKPKYRPLAQDLSNRARQKTKYTSKTTETKETTNEKPKSFSRSLG